MKRLITAMLMVAAAVFFLQSCMKHEEIKSPTTFVLVHGSFQGAYVWQYVKNKLEAKGNKVVVVELPGHGSDYTPPVTLSINAYRDKVIAAITPLKGKVVLVGHSMGGMVISATAETIPERIEKLVYIAGFIPVNGQALIELASTDSMSLLGPALVPSADMLTLDIAKDAIVPIFCQDGSSEVKNLLINNYRAEPAIPFTNKVPVTNANFGRIDKYYIHTLQDRALGINLQRRMVAATGIVKTYSLNSSHSPFLSMPDAVSDILMEIGK